MEKHLIGFVTKNGSKHLGYYTPIINPCADYREADSIVKMYTDEYGKEYKDVKEEVHVNIFPLYFCDKESEDYKLLPAPHTTTIAERMAHLFSEDLITEDNSIRMTYLWMIREWLYLNADCSQPVFIDKDYTIHSEGFIKIKDDVKEHIPDYINIKSDS
ncbi:MAG: hypothetical protein J5769_02315 [Bacteroidales bacterium]|nr:hypothetical protein [Bacteroidales bacterium]